MSGYTAKPLGRLRKVIAQHLHHALQATAQLTLHSECDVSGVVAARQAPAADGRPTYNTYVLRATALALQEHPWMNAHLVEDELRAYEQIRLGVAVNLEEGLVVTVITDAGRHTLGELDARVRDLSERARLGKLELRETRGATFTVTNLGPFGIDAFTPILNPPEIGLLGVGRIRETCRPTAQGCAVRSVLTLSLTFDHRAIDGTQAARFLAAVSSHLENPHTL